LALSVVSQAGTSSEDSLRSAVQDLIARADQMLDKMTAANRDMALLLADSAVALSEREFGYYDSLHARSLYSLALTHHYRNDPIAALSYAEMMSEIVDSAFSDNVKLTVYALALLGDSYREISEYSRALAVYDREIQYLKRIPPPLSTEEASWLVQALDDYAVAQSVIIGVDDGTVLERFREALNLAREYLGTSDGLYASTQILLAWNLSKNDEYDEAYELMAEALPVLTEIYGPEHLTVIWASCRFADILKFRDVKAADSIIREQMDIIDRTLGEAHPFLGYALAGRITLLAMQDSLETAVKEARRLVDYCRQKSDFPSHSLADALRVLGKVAVVAGKHQLLAETIEDLSSTRHSYLMSVFGYASEAQKLSFVRMYPPIEPQLLAGAIQNPDPITDAAAINMVLRGKGLALDAMAAQQTAAVCAHDPVLDSLLLEHGRLCERIASIVFSSAGKSKDEILKDLFSSKNSLETEMSTLCTGLQFPGADDSVSISAVISALPHHSALLEYVRYEDYDYDNIFMNREYDSAYAAIVLTSSGEKSIVYLDDAPTVDGLIEQYHKTMSDALTGQLSGEADNSTDRLKNISVELYSGLVKPLEKCLSGIENIYVVADGAVNLLPFETLTKNGDRYLIEDYRFVYLTSGRDLLKEKPDLSGPEALVLADPDYMIESSPLPAYRGNSATPECLGSMFSPLPMTRQEGKSVAELLKQTGRYDVTYLETDQAREGALKNLNQPPAVLHIATHGYFCEQAENPYLSNPLLRSGLILAGANRTIGDMNRNSISGEDGILTAMEVSGLNLIGTDLVVLSACQTGIGDVQNGEGVFGLRRAFQHAGAKSVIMSMFSVPDESTSDIMERFYENWLSGESKSSALRDASLSILNERRSKNLSTHPLFWGGFIIVGDPE